MCSLPSPSAACRLAQPLYFTRCYSVIPEASSGNVISPPASTGARHRAHLPFSSAAHILQKPGPRLWHILRRSHYYMFLARSTPTLSYIHFSHLATEDLFSFQDSTEASLEGYFLSSCLDDSSLDQTTFHELPVLSSSWLPSCACLQAPNSNKSTV